MMSTPVDSLTTYGSALVSVGTCGPDWLWGGLIMGVGHQDELPFVSTVIRDLN